MENLSQLEISCDFTANGCDVYVKLCDLLNHTTYCPFDPVGKDCQFDCGAKLLPVEVESHNCIDYLKSVLVAKDIHAERIMKENELLKESYQTKSLVSSNSIVFNKHKQRSFKD